MTGSRTQMGIRISRWIVIKLANINWLETPVYFDAAPDPGA
jgi:hypothetical protein